MTAPTPAGMARPDIVAWQTARSEWFQGDILDIVTDFAAFRDTLAAQPSAGAEGLSDALDTWIVEGLKDADRRLASIDTVGCSGMTQEDVDTGRVSAYQRGYQNGVKATLTDACFVIARAHPAPALTEGYEDGRPAGWSYCYDDGLGKSRYTVLNDPSPLLAKKPPTKHYGGEITDVRPFFYTRPAPVHAASEPEGGLAKDRWPNLRVSEVDAMRADANAAMQMIGYRDAFYELANLMGLPASPESPKVVWETVMEPRLRSALTKEAPAPAAAGAGEALTFNERLSVERAKLWLKERGRAFHPDDMRTLVEIALRAQPQAREEAQPDSGGVVEDCQTQGSVDRAIGNRIAQQMRDKAKKLDRSDKPQMAAELREEADAIERLAALSPVAAEGGEVADGCGYTGHEFGAPYPDSTCIEGYLWDLDSCDEPGGGLTSGGDIPCPKCNPEDRAALRTEPTGGGEGA